MKRNNRNQGTCFGPSRLPGVRHPIGADHVGGEELPSKTMPAPSLTPPVGTIYRLLRVHVRTRSQQSPVWADPCASLFRFVYCLFFPFPFPFFLCFFFLFPFCLYSLSNCKNLNHFRI
jgi:hypothetical protein